MNDEYCYSCGKYINIENEPSHFIRPQACCITCSGTGIVQIVEFDNPIEMACECTLETNGHAYE